MGKSKNPATGEGFLGEIMVHKISRAVGVVNGVTEAQTGWPPQISLKLADGTVKKGRLSDFRKSSGNERAKISAVEWPPEIRAVLHPVADYPLF
jgi:hypothetical protein